MGWGAEFDTTVFISHLNVNNVEHAKELIEDEKANIESAISQLKMFAAANTNDIVPEDWSEQKIAFIAQEIDEIMEGISDSQTLIVKLQLYVDKIEIYDKLEKDTGN